MNPVSFLLLMSFVGDLPPAPSIADMLRGLGDPAVEVRRKSLLVLKASGASSNEVVARLAGRLKEESYDDLKGDVMILLGQLARQNDRALTLLIEALDDTFLSSASSQVLRRSHIPPERLAPALWQAMANKVSPLQGPMSPFDSAHPIVRILASLGEPALPILVQGLEAPSKFTRRHAALGLGLMGGPAEPHLWKALASPDVRVREVAPYGVLELAVHSDDFDATACKVMTMLLRDKDWRVRLSVAESLYSVCGLIEGFVPELRQALKDEHREVRREVLRLLGRLKAKEAFPDVLRALRDRSESVTVQALDTLPKLGRLPADYLPAVLDLLQSDPNRAVRQATVKFLIPFGSRAKEMVPVLLETMAFRYEYEFDTEAEDQLFIEAFGAIGPDAKEATPFLIRQLSTGVPRQLDACVALVKVGHHSDRIVDMLVWYLREQPMMRSRCLTALTEIGPPAAKAAPVLDKLLATFQKPESFDVFGEDRDRAAFAAPYLSVLRDDAKAFREHLLRFRRDGMLLEKWDSEFLRMPLRAEVAVPAILAVLEKYPEVCDGTIRGIRQFSAEKTLVHRLAMFGPEAKSAVPLLSRLLKAHLPDDLKAHAALALLAIDAEADGQALLPFLRFGAQEDNSVRFEIKGRVSYGHVGDPALRCRCLGALLQLKAVDEAEAIASLLKLQRGSGPEEAAALHALAPYVKTNPRVARVFRQSLDSQSQEARTIAQRGLSAR